MILIRRWSCGDPELETNRGPRSAFVHCTTAKGVVLGFPGVLPAEWGFRRPGNSSRISRAGSGSSAKGVNNGVSWWRVTSWMFKAMDCQKSASQYPVDNRNHSGWSILVSWVQPCDLVQQSDNKCQWFPGRSSEVASLMTAWISSWCRSEWWRHQVAELEG